MIKLVKLLAIFSWMLLIFITSTIAFPEDDPMRKKALIEYFSDKSMHLLMFGALSYFIIIWLRDFKIKFYRIAIIAILFCFLYGITDEWHQGFISGRGVSYYDLLFDVIGGVAGILFFQIYHKKPVENIIKQKVTKKKKS